MAKNGKQTGGGRRSSSLGKEGLYNRERRERRERRNSLQSQLTETNKKIGAIQRSPDGDARQLEALRRKRMGILLALDKLAKQPPPARFGKGAGPRYGVYSVAQGGSPGSGKRA